MPRKRALVPLALVVGFACLAVAPAALGQDLKIEARRPPGFRWAFEVEKTFKARVATTIGSEVVELRDSTLTQYESGVATILGGADGSVDAVRVVFADDCRRTLTNHETGASDVTKPGYAGQTVTISLRPPFSVSCEAKLAQDEVEEIGHAFGTYRDKAARTPKRVGESVTFETGVVGMPGTSTETLRGPRDYLGRRCAELAVVSNIAASFESGTTLRMKLEGASFVDLETGLAISTKLEGPISMEGTRSVERGGKKYVAGVSGTGTMTVTIASRPLAPTAGPARPGGATATPGGATPSTGAPASPKPAPSPVASVNPEVWYVQLLDALKSGSYAAYEKLHAPEVRERISQDGFALLVGKRQALGHMGKFKPAADGKVKVYLPDGTYLATIKDVGGAFVAVEPVE